MSSKAKIDITKSIKLKRFDGFLVSNMKNIRYLTGFTGSSGFAIISAEKKIFFTDFRYKEQAVAEVRGWEIGIEKGRRINLIRDVLKKLNIKRLIFEASVSYEFYELLKKLDVTLEPQKNLVEKLRKIKSEQEICLIKKAVERAEKAFLKVKPYIRPGTRERHIALRLEEELKKGGCSSLPFDIIVASGKNSAMPHAKPSDKKIEKGDFVIIDWGGEADGYYSDMTRTFLMNGNDLSEKTRIYNIVNDARKKAVNAVKVGNNTRNVDSAARDEIKKAGFGEYFGHGTGHGVGLDVHEYPHVSRIKGERISNGMVFTIEPGIYIPNTGGVRIEDMIEVRNGSARLLTSLGRELEIIR